MRLLSIATFSLLTACSAGETATAVDARASTGDGGVDADAFDAQNYGSEDFSSFRYSFYGTGISGSVSMDRDCGIASKGATLAFAGPGVPTGNGVVAAADCDAFKGLTVSSDVLTSLEKYKTTTACSSVTDDYLQASVTLVDGTSVATANLSGCSEAEPFKKLRTEAGRLANKYVTADAGAD